MDSIQPGQMLGPYRILGQVGQGGMATVYKAYHAAMDRYVALKVLSPEFARSEQLKGRFQQEARIIANLEHKHILPVHDFGISDGLYYFVMRFLDSGSLKERIGSGPLSLADVDRIFSQLAEALDYAHQRGVIHRDVKPANVLVDSRGDAFLTDFGIAKLVEGTSQFTATNAVTGTPAYMSPEQAQGDKLDARTDIYSLGIMLYEMLTGQVPFDADTPLAVMMKHVSAPLPLPSEFKPGLHPEIERVLLKALSKDRNDRFATCQEFLNAWKLAYAAASAAGQPGTRLKSAVPTQVSKPAVVSREKPASRPAASRKLALWIGVVAAVLALIILSSVGGVMVYNRLKVKATASQEAVQQALSNGQPVGESAIPANQAGGEWTSWVGGNQVWLVATGVERVFSAGEANVSIWNRQDGSLLRRLTTADGLPGSSEMNALLVEGEDTLWIGTNDGLYFFDGQALKRYGSDRGLESESVKSLLRLEDGRLLVGTYTEQDGGGLNVFDGSFFTAWDGFPSLNVAGNPDGLSSRVDALAEDQDGSVWVGTPTGLGRWDGSQWRRFTTSDGLPANAVTRLRAAQDGNVLVGTESGAVFFDGENFQRPIPEDVFNSPIFGLADDSQGRYWFSGDTGIWIFNPEDASVEHLFDAEVRQMTYTMFGVAADEDGNVYAGSDGKGLTVFQEDLTATNWMIPDVPSRGNYSRILAGPDGKLWFNRADNQGMDVFNLETGQWEGLLNDLRGIPLSIDLQGSLWMNEWPTGLWIAGKDGSETHITEQQGLPAEAYVDRVIFGKDGKVWLGTSQGLGLLEGSQVTDFFTTETTGLKGDEIRALCAASDGSLWVSSHNNLSLARRKPDGSWEQFGLDNPFQVDWVEVNDIVEDANGAIWIATSGDGVYRNTGGEWMKFAYGDPGVKLPSQDVGDIYLAPDGSLWFGTADGAARFDGKAWTGFAWGPGSLVSRGVQDIYQDAAGRVYFATDGGVTRWKP